MERTIKEFDNPLRCWNQQTWWVHRNSIIIHQITTLTLRIFHFILELFDDQRSLLVRDSCSLGANSVRAYCFRLQVISSSIVQGLLCHLLRIDRAVLMRINKFQSKKISMVLNQMSERRSWLKLKVSSEAKREKEGRSINIILNGMCLYMCVVDIIPKDPLLFSHNSWNNLSFSFH